MGVRPRTPPQDPVRAGAGPGARGAAVHPSAAGRRQTRSRPRARVGGFVGAATVGGPAAYVRPATQGFLTLLAGRGGMYGGRESLRNVDRGRTAPRARACTRPTTSCPSTIGSRSTKSPPPPPCAEGTSFARVPPHAAPPGPGFGEGGGAT